MNLSKRHLVLSCFLSIVHIEKTETRVSLFKLRLSRYPKIVKVSINLLKKFSMTTTLSYLIGLKLIFKIATGKTKLIKFENLDALGFYCTLNQKKAIDRLSNELKQNYTNFPNSYLYLTRAFCKSILISFTKRKKLKSICEMEFNLLTELIKYIFYYNYIDQYIRKFPKYALVANDHSPEPLAFTSIAKLRSSKLVYLQHGHVSKYFPPLFRFDLSVLYGRKSLDIYQEIGELSKNIVLSGYKFDTAKSIQACPKRFNITIFPNVINTNKILKIVKELSSSDNVQTINLKPHPLHLVWTALRAQLEEFKKVRILPSDYDFKSETDVGLAGNSSIHMELLSEGIPSIYFDDLDQIDYDYYNFVSSKTVMEVSSLENLASESINQFYQNINWKNNAEYFDAGFQEIEELNLELKKIHTFFK